MRVTFCFDRDKPFARHAGRAPADLIDRYEHELLAALNEAYPNAEISVEHVVGTTGDVIFAEADGLEDAERLELALAMRRIAHRVADSMLAKLLRSGS